MIEPEYPTDSEMREHFQEMEKMGLVYEDDLPEMTDAEYSEWYAKSEVVFGVRMGPPFKREVPMAEIEIKIGTGRCPIQVKPQQPIQLPPIEEFVILDYLQLTDPDGKQRMLSDAEKKRFVEFMRQYNRPTMPVFQPVPIAWQRPLKDGTLMQYPHLMEDVYFMEVPNE